MIWATDGNPDTFWIKIWWEDSSVENNVYDNNMRQPIEVEPSRFTPNNPIF